ncbi:MAG TPA: leucyl/phenylalanyl-tRNA--protein transferase [Pseudobdellovibrionaceae bacterium]|nr:leucyl/phenylalanyl-tRNA--protein transferase [Pseudobdellovibrionaceae bacterium]
MKSSIRFPDPNEFSTPEGLIHVGGKMDSGTLLEAYSHGIFPWPHEDYPWLWFSPPERGILNFEKLHISHSLKKFRKNHPDWRYTVNTCFSEVMTECQQQKRPGQPGTWILNEMIPAYSELSKLNRALSVEIWSYEKSLQPELVGGIYGVLLPKYFSAESMFYKKPNASKLALWFLVEELSQRGYSWMDLQMVTPVTQSFGAELISRKNFLERIRESS